MIEYRNVGMKFGTRVILENLSLTIKDHELFVLVGPSGSGKTTLIRMINRLTIPTSGQIYIDGQSVNEVDLPTLRLSMGYVLQTSSLFPNLTVGENITIQLEQKKVSLLERLQRATELLGAVGLTASDFIDRYPAELSGGQQQRVAIARALATKPQLILMDESFSALDPVLRSQMQALLLKLHDQYQMTILFVTHDMKEALRLGDRIGVINEGHLLQVGTPTEIINYPATPFVTNFFASAKPSLGTLPDLITTLKLKPQDLEIVPQVRTVADVTKLPIKEGKLSFNFEDQSYQLEVSKLLHYLGKQEEHDG